MVAADGNGRDAARQPAHICWSKAIGIRAIAQLTIGIISPALDPTTTGAKDEVTDAGDIPGAVRGTVDGNLRRAIPVIVGRHRDVTVLPIDCGADTRDIPGIVQATEDGDLRTAVPVVVARDWDVAALAIDGGAEPRDIPGAVGRTEDRNVIRAIP